MSRFVIKEVSQVIIYKIKTNEVIAIGGFKEDETKEFKILAKLRNKTKKKRIKKKFSKKISKLLKTRSEE